MAVAFTIPFFLQVKWFAFLQFSMVELLLLPCVVAWLVYGLWFGKIPTGRNQPIPLPEKIKIKASTFFSTLASRLYTLFWPQDGLDWAIASFTVWGGLSLLFADTQDVAIREFRVVVSQSAMWFWLIRRSQLNNSQRIRLLDMLIASATVVSLYCLYQWLFTAELITAEGVRRIKAVYG